MQAGPQPRGSLHHVELWVPDLAEAEPSWQWLLTALDYHEFQRFEGGVSYLRGDTYLVLEESPDLSDTTYERTRPGLNHLAFHAGSRGQVDELVEGAIANGWTLMFADRHPHAGGPDHYAGFLENDQGFEVELVAD